MLVEYLLRMKPIKVMFEEALLDRLDATEEVRKLGRSAVLRRATREYLERIRSTAIAEAYHRAYATTDESEAIPGTELSGWGHQGQWPKS